MCEARIIFVVQLAEPACATGRTESLDSLNESCRRAGVTGFTVCGYRSRIHVIEGDFDSVTDIYDAVCADARYASVRQFGGRMIKARRYSDLGMLAPSQTRDFTTQKYGAPLGNLALPGLGSAVAERLIDEAAQYQNASLCLAA